MKIKTAISYNLDLLCFMNVMTGESFYTEFHKESFEKFYPSVSGEIKNRIGRVKKLWGNAMIGTAVTTPISAMDNFNDRDLIEMLESKAELKNSMRSRATCHRDRSFSAQLLVSLLIKRVTIPLAKELERAGFKEFWHTHRLPLISEKCGELDEYMKQYDIAALMNRYKKFDKPEYKIYLCSFTRPLGSKLCGDDLISDCAYKCGDTLEIAAHEMFHAPYEEKKVKRALGILAKKPWVIKAYKNQTPETKYKPMNFFIEENIVEALGVYVAVQVGQEINTKEYFETHDDGSHVISPPFYDYLCANKKDPSQPFEDYFAAFVDSL